MRKGYSFDVFLSYSLQDRAWVSQFASALRDAGIKTWFDYAEIPAGEKWQDVIQKALRSSKVLVVILSRNNVTSPWTFFELGAAMADHKRIIPVVSGEIDLNLVPFPLTQFQFLRESSPDKAGRRVAELIKESRKA